MKEEIPISEVNGIAVNTSYMCSGDCYIFSSREIKYVVIHYTGNKKDTALNNALYFYNNAGKCGASAHYFVDDTSIYQSKSAINAAWAVGGTKIYKHRECRNLNSISIEMCCTAGNYTASDKTITNTEYLCAELYKVLGIAADDVDRYVLRHYDVWDKECPAQFVTNPSEWINFLEKAKSILNGEENGMTADEKQAFTALQNQVNKQSEQINSLVEQCGYYNYIDDNMNECYRPTVCKLVNLGLIQGVENEELRLTNDMMRILTIMDRTDIFDIRGK